MAPHFLDFPPEILAHILSCLFDLHDLFSCKLTHPSLYTCIRDYQVLQYHIAKQTAGVDDNPHSNLPISDRLALLKGREDGWAKLQVDVRKSIAVRHPPSGIYDLTGGVYLLGNENQRTLHYCVLPSKSGDEMRWSRIDIDNKLIDMALAIYEHDLIAIVTTSPSETSSNMHIIEVQLIQFSTGKPHPLARSPIIRVYESPWDRPSVGMEIVGENLALILSYPRNPFHPDDSFHIIDWKKGTLKMEISTPSHTYSGLVFLSPDILLLPNTRENTLDLWKVPETAETAPIRPIRALGLPALSDFHFISNFSCRGELPPVARDFPYSPEPFHAKPSDAIMIFNIRILRIQMTADFGSSSFSVFIHRSALRDLCPDTPDAPPSWGFGNEMGGESVVEDDNEAPEIETASHAFPKIVPWEQWGPAISRWFDTEEMPSRWITTSAGQRCVMYTEVEEITGAWGPSLVVLDFNPWNVKKRKAESSSSKKPQVVTQSTVITSDMFESPIVSSLPYTVSSRMEFTAVDGVLMDEERLLALRTDDSYQICEIEIIHFGVGNNVEMSPE